MAELVERVKFESMQGKVQDVKLYSTLEEVSGQGVPVSVAHNLISLDKRNFVGWTAYYGAVVTLTQNISMPEWGTNEATRVQTSGGTNVVKYYVGGISIPTVGTKCVLRCFVKNQGVKPVSIGTNLNASVLIGAGKQQEVLLTTTGNGTGAFQFLIKTSSIEGNIGDSLDVVMYKPEMFMPDNAVLAYMKYGEVSDVHATAARVNRYENLIPPGKRKFEGWTVYQGAVATVTQGISVPEWDTNEATRIQTTGGTSLTKYYLGYISPPEGVPLCRRIKFKNQGKYKIILNNNGIGDTLYLDPNESTDYVSYGVGTGRNNIQIHFMTTDIAHELDIVAYQPALYYMSDLDKIWAICSQALPYGPIAYTVPGVYTFTVPAGVTRLRITCAGAGGGGSGELQVPYLESILVAYGTGAGNGGLVTTDIATVGNSVYSVVVGAGGRGGVWSSKPAVSDTWIYGNAGADGGQSSVGGVVAAGGRGATTTAVYINGQNGATSITHSSRGADGTPLGAGAVGGGFSSSGGDGWVIIKWGDGI